MADRNVQGVITTQNLVSTGDATSGSSVEIDAIDHGTVSIQVTGTYTGALSAQVTTDGRTWVTLSGARTFTKLSDGTTSATISSGAVDVFQVISIVGVKRFRVSALGAVTGSATVTLRIVPFSTVGSVGSTNISDATNQGRAATVDAAGNLLVALGTTIEGEDSTYHRLWGGAMADYVAVSADGQVGAAGRRVVYGVYCVTDGAINLHDGTSNAGQKFFSRSMVAGDYISVADGIGLRMVTGCYADITLGTYIVVVL